MTDRSQTAEQVTDADLLVQIANNAGWLLETLESHGASIPAACATKYAALKKLTDERESRRMRNEFNAVGKARYE